MTQFFKNLYATIRRPATLLALTLGVAGFATPAADARDYDNRNNGRYGDRHGRDYRHGDERRYDRDRGHDHDHDKTDVRIRIGGEPRTHVHERTVRHWVAPRYETVRERVWVEPVYRTTTERVWVGPVYKTVYGEVHVPARYEVREIVRYERRRKIVTRERVLVEAACTKRVPRRVCVSEGHWDTVERRVCVAEGHWDVVERQVCVSEGHWDYRVEHVEVTHEPRALLDLRF